MRKFFGVLSWLVALAGVGVTITHLLVDPSLADTLYLAATVALGVSLAISAVAIRPDPKVWPFVMAIVAFSVVGQLFDDAYALTDTLHVFSDASFFVVQFVLIIGLVIVVSQRLGHDAKGALADGVIIGLGAWVLVWVWLLQPTFGDGSVSSLSTAFRGATLGLSTIVLFLLATLFFSDAVKTTSVVLGGAGIAATLLGDVLFSANLRADVNLSAAVADSPYVLGLFLVAASFLHPTIRDITAPATHRQDPPLLTRLVTTTLALVLPIAIITATDARDTTDRVVRTVSIVVLAAAVITRVIQSVRDNAKAQASLLRAARLDSLTGLPNRSLMLEHITQAIQESWKSKRQPTVLFIDVDRFKNINDSLGHMTGDDVLSAVAKRLTNAVTPDAIVGRISGDEFVVLDPSTETSTQAVLLAERVLDAFREHIALRQGDMFVSASIGVAMAEDDEQLTAEDLLRRADTAMYRAKDAGRNCIALYDDSMLERVSQRLSVETALYRALDRRELRLVHQPILDTEIGIVVGFEALMRWTRDDGDVSPAEFIPIAEETGTIVPIGSWAVLDALTHLRRWIDSGVVGSQTTMSVNVSPRQLHDPNFVAVVSEALSRSRIAADQLWLEVTESVMMTEPEQALSSLRRLVSLGVRVAIDDFGTGYSSLSLLQKFPIQRIKIDRVFVSNLAEDQNAQSLVRTIIAMADSLSLDIVAEGVENREQLRALSQLHCHKAQGYLISHPVSVDAVPSTVAHLENHSEWSALRRGRPS